MSRRCELTGKGRAGRAQGEPLQPQDQAAVPAQPAQRHHDVGRARPLGPVARVGQRLQDRRSPRRARRLPAEGEGRRTVRARRSNSSARSRRSAPRQLGNARCARRSRPLVAHGSASVNCSSSVRWSSEKLSSEISVSTVSPRAPRWTLKPFHVVDLVAEIGLEQDRPVDQRARLDARASAMRRMRMTRPLGPAELPLQQQEVAAGQQRGVADVEIGAALDREGAGPRPADQESRGCCRPRRGRARRSRSACRRAAEPLGTNTSASMPLVARQRRASAGGTAIGWPRARSPSLP